VTRGAKEFLAEQGFDPVFGARPLRRAIHRYIEDPIAEEIMRAKFTNGSIIKAAVNKKTQELKFKEGNNSSAGKRK
jgi:ATP-dependent Clp protease ATP-binding subunit ClpC